MSHQHDDDDGGWKVQSFATQPGKRFLNIGIALYEIIEQKDLARFDTTAQLDLYPYRDVATGTLIKPGEEGLCKSSADTTLIVAKIVAGQQWTTPKAARAGIAERVARQRAEFDLRNGASKQAVQERLDRDLSKKTKNTATGDEEEDDEDEEVDWNAMRRQIDGGAGTNGGEDEVLLNDNDNGGADEEEDDEGFSDDDGEDGGAFATAAENGGAGDDDDDAPIHLPGQGEHDGDDDEDAATKKKKKKRSKSSPFDAPGGGTFASYGLLSGAPAGAPVLNIDCSRVDPATGYASAAGGYEPDEDDNYADNNGGDNDEHHRNLLADMDELDRAARGDIYDDDDDDDDIDDADLDDLEDEDDEEEEDDVGREEFDAQGRPIMYPNNVELDKKGRVTRRLDNALTGATSQEAQVAQYRRELQTAAATSNGGGPAGEMSMPAIRPRTTLNASAMLAERGQTMNKTLGDELKEFGLPPDMMAQLAQQGALSQQVGDAQFPQSVDEIAHLARPFKSALLNKGKTSNSDTTGKSDGGGSIKLRSELPPSTSSATLVNSGSGGSGGGTGGGSNSASGGGGGATLTIPITLGDLLSLRTNITAQMRAITALSESVDNVLLAKMANVRIN